MKSEKTHIPSLWALCIASGLSPLGMSIIIPVLASIAAHFSATLGATQYVVSAYLFGLGISQPLCGFLCDRFGRRPVMLAGFALFTLASGYAVFATSLDELIIARLLQGVGVSVGTVTARAILRDTHSPSDMAKSMSYIMAFMGVAPIVAPAIGGFFEVNFGYASIFALVSVLGACVWVYMLFNLSETLPADAKQPNFCSWSIGYGQLLISPSFLGNTLAFAFIQGSYFSFISIGASLFDAEFGIDAATFGLLWGLMAIFYVSGATLSAKLYAKMDSHHLLDMCVWLNVATGLFLLMLAIFGELNPLKVLAPFAIQMILAGIIAPGMMTGAIIDHPKIAGSASGLSSAFGLVLSGLFTIIAGNLFTGDYKVIAIIMSMCGLLAAVSWQFTKVEKNQTTRSK